MASTDSRIVISAEDRTQSAFESVRRNLGSLEQSISGIGSIAARLPILGATIATAFSGAAFGGMIKGAIDAADELNDLSQKTGIAVTDLAGLKLVAEQSGTSLEGVAKATQKLAQYMTVNSAELARAGITATTTTGVLIQLADQFQTMGEGQEATVRKIAVARELMGKTGADMIPLLNQGGDAIAQLIAQGQKLNPVTAEMAKQADEFNDKMAVLSASTRTAAIAIANDLLPALNALAGRLAEAFSGGFVEGFVTRWQAAFKGLAAGANEIGAQIEGTLARITWGETSERHAKAARDMLAQAQSIYRELAKLAPEDASGVRTVPRSTGTGISALVGSGALGTRGPSARSPSAAELLAQMNKTNDYREELRDKSLAENEAILANAKAAADAQRRLNELLAATPTGQLEKLQGDMKLLADELERGNITEQQFSEATAARIGAIGEKTKEATNYAKDLGLAFSSAFEDAVVGGKNFSDVLKGLADDILRLLARKNITEPLANAVGSFDFAGLFKSFLPSADGNVMAGPGISAFSSQIVSRPTLFPFANGIGLMGEAGAEAIMPLTRIGGKLGVRAQGAGGITINIKNEAGADGYRASATSRDNGSGGLDIDVVIARAVQRDIARNGPMTQSFLGLTGSRRAAL